MQILLSRSSTLNKIFSEARTLLSSAGPFILPVFALSLWFIGVKHINVRLMNDLGLVSVLPAIVFIALTLLTVSFSLTLRQHRLVEPYLLLQVIVLIFMLYSIKSVIDEVPGYAASYKHIGIVEYIVRNKSLDTKLSAYFNWPGFFILGAFLTEVSGIKNGLSLTRWAPFTFNLLYLGPLYLIFKGLANEKRLVWLGIWFFYLTNWVSQDTFAPQAFDYFLFLVVIGILVNWFKTSGFESVWTYRGNLGFLKRALNKFNLWLGKPDLHPLTVSPLQRVLLLGLIVVVLIVMIPSHQLTPFALLLCVTALVIFKKCSARDLPVIIGIMIATWLVFMTTDFLSGHKDMVIGGIGKVDEAVSANVTDRVKGSLQHTFIVQIRLAMSLAFWSLASLGVIRRFQNGIRDVTPALLAVAPFPLLAAAFYGGEMLLRVYLFSLPAMAFCAAALFFPTSESWKSWWVTALIVLTSILLLTGFLFTRYGNERIDYYTQGEFDAMNFLYRTAPQGSKFVVLASNLPWQFQNFEKYRYVDIKGRIIREDNVDSIASLMNDNQVPSSYLIITRSEEAFATMFAGISPEKMNQFERVILNSGRFQIIFSNRDAIIFVLKEHQAESDKRVFDQPYSVGIP